MRLSEYGAQVSTPEGAFQYLQERRILRSQPPQCIRNDCLRFMTQVKLSKRQDPFLWRCPTHKGCSKSIRIDSFLAKAHISLSQFCEVLYAWAYSLNVNAGTEMSMLSKATVMQWYEYFREVCSRKLRQNPVRLGGPGEIVEIDESIMSRHKYNHEGLSREGWVFGMYDVGRNRGFLQFVEDRSRETLLPIIERVVVPGSIIHSNNWEAYKSGAIHAIPVVPPYEHKIINRSGACINQVQLFWRSAKGKTKAASDLLYLDEFLWRQEYGGAGSFAVLENLLLDIAEFYPVNN